MTEGDPFIQIIDAQDADLELCFANSLILKHSFVVDFYIYILLQVFDVDLEFFILARSSSRNICLFYFEFMVVKCDADEGVFAYICL